MILYHLSSENEGTVFNLPKKDEEKFEKRVLQTLSNKIKDQYNIIKINKI